MTITLQISAVHGVFCVWIGTEGRLSRTFARHGGMRLLRLSG
jgi:hypothetical protein